MAASICSNALSAARTRADAGQVEMTLHMSGIEFERLHERAGGLHAIHPTSMPRDRACRNPTRWWAGSSV